MTAKRHILKQVFRIKKLRTELMAFIITALAVPSLVLAVNSSETSKTELQGKMEETTESSVHLLNKTLEQLIQLESSNVNQLAYQITTADLTANSPRVRNQINKFKADRPVYDRRSAFYICTTAVQASRRLSLLQAAVHKAAAARHAAATVHAAHGYSRHTSASRPRPLPRNVRCPRLPR